MRTISLTCALVLSLMMGVAASASAQAKLSDMDKKELAMLAGLEKKHVAAEAAFKKKPADAKLKKTHLDAARKLADAVLVSPALAPKDKYPKSLRLYRGIVKVEPKNAHAKKQIDLIEGIYRSMGRPIPK